jgi:hypothetical protein
VVREVGSNEAHDTKERAILQSDAMCLLLGSASDCAATVVQELLGRDLRCQLDVPAELLRRGWRSTAIQRSTHNCIYKPS